MLLHWWRCASAIRWCICQGLCLSLPLVLARIGSNCAGYKVASVVETDAGMGRLVFNHSMDLKHMQGSGIVWDEFVQGSVD